ncbi:MAG: tRNA (adenosine(37)-N6)-threonylcarbamoyltransferase complex transferase subunit TsaD [Desulforhopalus sp.]|jgi:N6-L-threonylcarbamoyladenine synthase|nr:tRNA (adenosine(37)-N6)-threonylcarbamoyltransferase complex transferase subunit TsaD [Desulforhopalus sp.]
MYILGIESSCDDTAAAVLNNGTVCSSLLTSQDAIHRRFGGVVPELASRKHLEAIVPMVDCALAEAGIDLAGIDLIAATRGPGLVGSLLVGYSYARALAQVSRIPLVGVDHIAGHILSVFLGAKPPPFPYISLVVSGGNSALYLAEDTCTFRLLGRTRDDAAGEVFDKVAKLLQLPYPGGPQVAARAQTGNREAIRFPRAWLGSQSLDFSFSGLKTAVRVHVEQQRHQLSQAMLNDICASFEEAVVEVLVEKTILAARQCQVSNIALGGGVSANNRLRERFDLRCRQEGLGFFPPDRQYSTDNAAMIALAGLHIYRRFGAASSDADVFSRSTLG